LLDNFSIEQTRAAVTRTAGRALLESSGRIDQRRFERSPKPAWI